MSQDKKLANLFQSASKETFGDSVREVRRSTGLNQAEFGKQFGVSQAAVSNWENDTDKPSPQVLTQLAEMTHDPDIVGQFIDASGMRHFIAQAKSSGKQNTTSTREIVQLRDANAAGTPRAFDKSEADKILHLPSDWFASGGHVFAFRIGDDSMAPVIEQGYLVFVDTSRREPPSLVDRMVVVRDDQVTIRWLQRDRNQYFLVPHHTSRSPVRLLSRDAGRGIVGEVVMWVGRPEGRSSTSPSVSIVQVWAEMEQRLRELAFRKQPTLRGSSPAVTSLLKINQIDPDLATQIKSCRKIRDNAAHGAKIDSNVLEVVRQKADAILAKLHELENQLDEFDRIDGGVRLTSHNESRSGKR